jgi:hypothetical protein
VAIVVDAFQVSKVAKWIAAQSIKAEPVIGSKDSQAWIGPNVVNVVLSQMTAIPGYDELKETCARFPNINWVVLPTAIVVMNPEVGRKSPYDVEWNRVHCPFIPYIPKDGKKSVPKVARDLSAREHVLGPKLICPMLASMPYGDKRSYMCEDLWDIQWVHPDHSGTEAYVWRL